MDCYSPIAMATDSVPRLLADASSSRILVDPESQPRIVDGGWAAALASRIRARLARRSVRFELAGLALVLLLPTVWGGLSIDDFFHRLVVEQKIGVPISRFDIFDFISNSPTQRARFLETGIYPWWMGAHTQVNYWRPVAALTHFVDYALWPRAAWLMHLENLAWYGGLVLACAALYRRFIVAPWIAALATAFYAFDHAHACPVAWVANRGAIMSMLFGVVAVIAHDRWRTWGRRRYGLLAVAAFALAVASAEAGVAIAGYLFAYAIAMDRAAVGRRVVSVVPYVGVMAAWRVLYRALGHGALASGANLDPLLDPRAFFAHALQSGPVLLASGLTGVPAEAMFEHPELAIPAAVGSVALLVLFGYAVLPLLRRDAAMRFLALGAAASVLPLGGTFPSDRYLFWAGLGLMGVAARLIALAFAEGASRATPLRFGFACACLLLRGVASPIAFPLRAAGPGLLEDDFERTAATIPRGPGFEHKTVVILSAPSDLFSLCLPIVAMARGLGAPAHLYTLYAGQDDVTFSRVDPTTLEARSQRGWLSRFTDRIFRAEPQQAGDTVHLEAMNAEVESVTADGRADAVRFGFGRALDDASSIVFLSWGANGFERVVPPRAGASLTLPAAPFFLADVMRPHVRHRAIEEEQ
jgi:hypothetical protein